MKVWSKFEIVTPNDTGIMVIWFFGGFSGAKGPKRAHQKEKTWATFNDNYLNCFWLSYKTLLIRILCMVMGLKKIETLVGPRLPKPQFW